MPLDEAFPGVVVGDDAGDFDVELARFPAREQVVEAVLLAAYEHNYAFFNGRVGDFPVQLHFFGQRRKSLAKFGQVKWQRVGLDGDAHKVAAAFGALVRVVVGLQNEALVRCDKANDAGNNADLVGARGGKGVIVFFWHFFNLVLKMTMAHGALLVANALERCPIMEHSGIGAGK